MKRSRTTNPFVVWTCLAWKTGETMRASAQVIHHRMARLAAVGARPSARDRRELVLMGQEKVEAGVESASAIAAQLMATNPWPRAFQHMMAGAGAAMSLAASRSARQAVARHSKLVRTMAHSTHTAAKLSVAAARLAQSGLKPIHARATTNAKRLSMRQRRMPVR